MIQLHNWLIKKIVGSKPVMMNLAFKSSFMFDDTVEKGFFCNCSFDDKYGEPVLVSEKKGGE